MPTRPHLATPGQQAPGPAAAPAPEPFVREGRKVGRNELCPCGQVRSTKQCHGKVAVKTVENRIQVVAGILQKCRCSLFDYRPGKREIMQDFWEFSRRQNHAG